MGYYRGDYYRGDYYSRYRGDPGIFGSIGSFLGGALKTVGSVASVLPGVGGIAGGVAKLAGGALQGLTAPKPPSSPALAVMPGGAMPTIAAATPMGLQPGQKTKRGGVTVGVSPLGTVGVKFRKRRRMNAGNAKAARHAIRRIKAVRHLLTSIERELPHKRIQARPVPRGLLMRGK